MLNDGKPVKELFYIYVTARNDMLGQPMYSIIEWERTLDNDPFHTAELEFVEGDYIDYSGVDEMAVYEVAATLDGLEYTFEPIVDYEGFCPSELFNSGEYSSASRRVFDSAYPVLYDCRNHLLRAYSRMVFRYKNISGITEIGADSGQPEYVSIDGRKVVFPQKGSLYICRRGSEVSKIIF